MLYSDNNKLHKDVKFLEDQSNIKVCLESAFNEADMELVKFDDGHNFISGFAKKKEKFVFFKIEKTNKMYTSTKWYNSIIIGKALNALDYDGYRNSSRVLKIDDIKDFSKYL